MTFTAPPANSTINYTVGVVESDATTRSELVKMINGLTQAVEFGTLESFTTTHVSGEPSVLVLGPSFGDTNVLNTYAEFSRTHPEVKAIAIMAELSPRLMQTAMRAGVDDVLSAEDDESQLISAIVSAAEGLSYLLQAAGQSGALSTMALDSDGSAGKIISIYSAKGGAGKSVIATNLAVSLARRTTQPVILIDGDLQFGDIAVMLKLHPRHTIMDAVSSMARLDSELLRSLLLKHEESGLYVLPAPVEPAFADQVTPADLARILELAREISPFVVVDTSSYLTEIVISVIEASDEILLIAGMDIPNIKNVKVVLQSLRQLDFPMDKIRLALNRANSKAKLDIGDVERTLGMKAEALIPSDVVIPRSVNKGVPAVIDAPRSEIAAAFDELAKLFIESPAVATVKKSRFF